MQPSYETVIIGGGQAGLALSRCLTDLGRDHLILERGRVAERWRSERWDSLRLLTPNWHSRLPGFAYQGDDPDGFMTRDEVVGLFESYAASFDPPVRTSVAVTGVEETGDGFWVETDRGPLAAANVVVATGHTGIPVVPSVAAGLTPGIAQLHSRDYRRPAQLPPGGVLVVGAASSGQQIATELHRAGRRVVLSVGSHIRAPRRYRGRDLFWWLDASGKLAETVDDVPDPLASRRAPSLPLSGQRGGEDLDLYRLSAGGVRLVGRLEAIDGTTIHLAGDLHRSLADADRRMRRLLTELDSWAARAGVDLPAEEIPPAPELGLSEPDQIDLADEGITSVVWATGFRPHFPFLRVPVLGPDGEPIQHRGITPVPGLAFLGLRWQHTRSSNFIDGVGRDAEYLAERIAANRPLALAS